MEQRTLVRAQIAAQFLIDSVNSYPNIVDAIQKAERILLVSELLNKDNPQCTPDEFLDMWSGCGKWKNEILF